MELYALKKLSSSDSNLHEVEPYFLEKAIHAGKGNIRILKASVPETKEPIAIKLFPKRKDCDCTPNFYNEERSASQLSHPHILKYHAFYNDALIQVEKDKFKEYSAIVMEYVPYGDLFGPVSQCPFSEKLARTVFKQMVSAIKYLHSKGYAHLDLKLENVLVDPKEGIKLIDFDCCQCVRVKNYSSCPKGSLGYRAPEFSQGKFEDLLAGDIYSLGVVLFILVMGTPPYNEVEKDGKVSLDKYYETLRTDVKKFWRVHEHYRENDGGAKLSKSFKDLVEIMLAEDPKKRPTVSELERMEWLNGETYTKEELKERLEKFFQK